MFPQYKLKTLLIGFVIVSVLLGSYVLFGPPANPRNQEGWDGSRVIRSQKALEIIESPEKITAYAMKFRETVSGRGPDAGQDIIAGPYVLQNPDLIKELTDNLLMVGKQQKLSTVFALVSFDLKLKFSRGYSPIFVYVNFKNPDLNMFEVYERGYYVGRHYEAPGLFKVAKEIHALTLANGTDMTAPASETPSSN